MPKSMVLPKVALWIIANAFNYLKNFSINKYGEYVEDNFITIHLF